jgi:anti-sigma-K factor RskA
MPDDLHDLTAAYALDALDSSERAAYEAHLETCERCRAELSSFGDVTGSLAAAVAGPAPSSELRGRILEEARGGGAEIVQLPRSRRRPLVAVGAVAAVAAAAAIGLGIWGVSQARELDSTRAALQQEREAARLLADPSARSVPLDVGTGRLVLDAGGRGVLVLDEISPAPTGRTYQAWVVDGEAPVSAGVFDGATSPTLVVLQANVPAGAVVAVTVEPAGGSVAPTTAPIATSPSV